MKIIIIFLSICLFPLSVSAQLEFFLSPEGASYDSNIWTSNISPDNQSDFISIEFHPSIAPVSNEYVVVDTMVQELFYTITTQSGSVSYETEEIQQFETSLYETLIATESPQFIEYITTSINPQTETIIEEKLEQNIVLTPFEETFYNCNISLEQRQEIVIDVLERIASGEIEDLENITYGDPKFGDCIIPFPDVSHRELVQENSFISNQLLAKTIQGTETKYETHESIETIIRQENQYQESIIEHEKQFSQLLEQSVISPSQYKLSQDIQSYYQDIISREDISYEQYSFLTNEFQHMSELSIEVGKLLEQGVVTEQEYTLFSTEIGQTLEMQKHYLRLLKSGEISQEEYDTYTREGQEYLQIKQQLIESYKNKIISETEYRKEITQMQQDFEENYMLLSESFGDSENKKPGNHAGYIYSTLIGFLVSILGLGLFVFIKKRKKVKKILGEK